MQTNNREQSVIRLADKIVAVLKKHPNYFEADCACLIARTLFSLNLNAPSGVFLGARANKSLDK